MLDALEQIPWSTLESTHGSAEDIPEYIRALLDANTDIRKNAQSELEDTAFYQGTINACTPYVARFLLELVQHEAVADKEWLFWFLSSLDQSARLILMQPEVRPNYDFIDEATEIIKAEWHKQQHQVAQDIHDQLEAYEEILFQALKSSDPMVQREIILYLTGLNIERSGARQIFQEAFAQEQDEITRAALVFALAATQTFWDDDVIETILADQNERIVVRMAAGFGLIMIYKAQTSDSILTQLTALLPGNHRALQTVDGLYQASSLPARLLDLLADLDPDQKLAFVLPLAEAYLHLPANKRSRISGDSMYYMGAIIHLAFPDGVLPAEIMIHDLNASQQAVLKFLQAHEVPKKAWDFWYSEDFRSILGIEASNTAQFLAFMDGKRSARRSGSGFDQVINERRTIKPQTDEL